MRVEVDRRCWCVDGELQTVHNLTTHPRFIRQTLRRGQQPYQNRRGEGSGRGWKIMDHTTLSHIILDCGKYLPCLEFLQITQWKYLMTQEVFFHFSKNKFGVMFRHLAYIRRSGILNT